MRPSDRDIQLSWFPEESIIKQDHDLIEYIRENDFRSIMFKGDQGYFRDQFIQGQAPYDFYVYIVNQSFDFKTLVNDLNDILQNQMTEHGIIYLSINKYLATAKRYDGTLSDDYDLAILDYISSNVDAHILKHQHLEDKGTGFNWVHPLTIFYLGKDNVNH